MQKNIFVLLLFLTSIINAREHLVVTKDIPLTLDSSLQKQVQSLTQSMKKKFQAKGVSIAVINSKTGNILSLADSNSDVIKDFPKNNIASFIYEPGFVIAPTVFSLALDKKLITPVELINGHQGHYRIRTMTITDHYPYDYISAANVIVHSSSIGMAQIAQKIKEQKYRGGLVKFGFTKPAVDWFSNENSGYIPSERRMKSDIYRVTSAYGYGIKVNLLQLLRAYNVFNDDGLLIKLKVFANIKATTSPKTVLDAKTAHAMKKILIETVEKGTGKMAETQGLEIGGKTGTAHVVKNGRYIKEYNCSFVGFVNGTKKSYTIAVLVREPQTKKYASETAVVVFKGVVDALVQEKLLNSFK